MVFIFSGEIDSGKSSRMMGHYYEYGSADSDGLVASKIFESGVFIGYQLTRLSNGEKVLLALQRHAYNDQFRDGFEWGRFIFSKAAFVFGESVLSELSDDPEIKNIYIDEIGPLELQGRGWAPSFQRALNSKKNLFVCIRSTCLNYVIRNFDIAEFSML